MILDRTSTTLTVLSLGLLGALWYSEKINRIDYQSQEIKLNGDELVKRLYVVAGGNDRIINSVEKRKLLDGLGIELIVDENEIISLVPSDKNKEIHVFILSGSKIDRYLGNRQYGFAGNVSYEAVEDYLKTVESKKGKK